MRSMRSGALCLFSLAALGLCACGGDGPEEPETPDIGGLWIYSAPDLVGGPVSCQITGVAAVLVQSGSDFSGTTQGGTITCQAADASGSEALNSYVITDGTVHGQAVTFTLLSADETETLDMVHTGTITENTMGGPVTAQLEMPAPYNIVVTLSGTWAAVRQ